MPAHNTYKVFLASSFHLNKERDEIQKAFNALNDTLNRKKAYLELVLWEKLDAGNHPERKQAFYNEQLAGCDILILVYQAEIGGFTKEEYLLAEDLFKQNGLPRIYLFKKASEASYELNPANVKNLQALEEIFYEKGKAQWPWEFEHYEGIVRKLNEDILRLFEDKQQPHFTYGEPAKLLSLNGVNDPTVFIGREEQLKEIEDRLQKGGSLLLMNAEGGIGKTTLAARYWNNTLFHYNYHAWLFCGNGILNALTELAPALGVDLTGMDEKQQLQALKQAIIQKQDGFLLVLDNANDPDDLKRFYREFQGLHWHLLVTSRCNGVIPKEKEMLIEHLPPELAKELFRKYFAEESADFEPLLERLLSGLRYHTLCIELFAKTMQELAERGETLLHLVHRLEEHGLFLGVRSFEIVTDYTTQTRMEASNSDEILDRFYDFTGLSGTERFWLVNMALLPAEEYAFTFLCTLFGQDPIPFNELHILAKRGWINETDGFFRISPVIQKLALKKNENWLGSDAQNMVDILNGILESDAYNFLHISITEAEPFMKPVFHLTKCLKAFPGEDLANYNFYCGLGYENTGNLVATQGCFSAISLIYQTLSSQNPENLSYKNGLAISYGKLGELYEQIGNGDLAIENYKAANSLFKEIYESSPENLSYKNGLAISYEKLGGIYEATGDWKNALLNYQEYYRLGKEIYESSPENLGYKNGLAISYGKLGELYEQIGNGDLAIENYKAANSLFKEIYESSPENLSYKNGLAISYEKLGGIYEATGDWKNALLNYQEYYRLGKEIYESSPENLSYKNGLAISYEKLGDIYEATGDGKNALLNYQERNKLGKEIYASSPENLSYKNGLAISYEKLGGIYEATGDWKNALLNYQERNKLGKEIYESSPENLGYKNGLAISYEKLGGIYEATGDWKNALLNYQEYYRLGKEIYESSPENLGYKYGLAISYSKLGGIYEATGDWKNALLNYQERNKLGKEIYESSPENLSYKNGLAISYGKLGGLYKQIGNGDLAIENHKAANSLFKEIYESSPENLRYKNGLAISYEKLGGIYEATGNWKNALLNYQERNKLGKEIYESSPENLSYKNGLAVSYSKLGGIYEATGDWKNALLNYQERNKLGKEIYESSPENLSYKNGLAISYSKLAVLQEKLEELPQAINNMEFALQLFKEVAAVFPESPSFQNNLAWAVDNYNRLKSAFPEA